MASRGFLYRRLARFIPCTLPHVGEGSLSLRDKYDIASMRDVFLSAHYWRVFEHLTSPPKLVVDLGAHCGHFSVLCHLAALEKFGCDETRYILVEAQPSLISRIHRVVDEAGFGARVDVFSGLVGKKKGDTGFQIDPRNLLSSRALPARNGHGAVLSYRDLDSILPSVACIDVLKIDIEGSEFDLLENYPHIFRAARVLLIEVHGPIEQQQNFEQELHATGLRPLSPAIVKENERLLCYGSAAALDLQTGRRK